MVLLLPLTVFSQDSVIVVFIDQTRYCLTEAQALATIEIDSINKGQTEIILNLNNTVTTLESKVADMDNITTVFEEIVEVVEEETELSKKENRKLKNKAILTWFKNNGEKLLIGFGGFTGGVAVGIGTGLSVN